MYGIITIYQFMIYIIEIKNIVLEEMANFIIFLAIFSFGSLFILLLYALIISRIIKIGNMTRSNFGKLYCYSFATAFFIYVVVNMMMVLGLLPIVGSPLPIMSYGGSSMLAIMFGLGIVMSCKIYKDVPVN